MLTLKPMTAIAAQGSLNLAPLFFLWFYAVGTNPDLLMNTTVCPGEGRQIICYDCSIDPRHLLQVASGCLQEVEKGIACELETDLHAKRPNPAMCHE